jgi:hypothetical protein
MSSPLVQLYQGVQALMAEWGVDCSHHFGWDQAPQTKGDGSIKWAPGDPDGNFGGPEAGRYIGELASLNETFHVTISNVDRTDPSDRLKQYEATRGLYTKWYAAAKTVGGVWLIHVSTDWLLSAGMRDSTPRVQNVWGAAVVCTFQLSSRIELPVSGTVDQLAKGIVSVNLGPEDDTQLTTGFEVNKIELDDHGAPYVVLEDDTEDP